MNINTYIQNNYNKLKNITRKTFNNYTDDVFHDTLYKVINLFKDKEVDDEMVGYIVSAVRNNINRQRHYAYNEKKIDVYDNAVNFIGSEIDMKHFDFERIMSDVRQQFGDDTHDIIYMFLDGYSVNEIQTKYGINNFYYILRKVKHFIKEQYGSEQ